MNRLYNVLIFFMTHNIYYLHLEMNRLYNVLIFFMPQRILLCITVICDYIHEYQKYYLT